MENIFLYMPAEIKGAYIDKDVKFEEGKKITVNIGTVIVGNVSIGEGSLISFNCSISAREHEYIGHKNIRPRKMLEGKISIGKDVWIGMGVCILPNVIIETGAVIGAGSVVVKGTHIPKFEVWAGNPAIKIKER